MFVATRLHAFSGALRHEVRSVICGVEATVHMCGPVYTLVHTLVRCLSLLPVSLSSLACHFSLSLLHAALLPLPAFSDASEFVCGLRGTAYHAVPHAGVCGCAAALLRVCVRPLSLPSARSPLLSFLSPLTLPCARCPPSIACALRCERVLCDICGALFSMPCRMPVFAAVQRLCFVCVLAAALVSLAMRVRCLTLRRLVGSPRCNYGS